jgi:hypothetical protein
VSLRSTLAIRVVIGLPLVGTGKANLAGGYAARRRAKWDAPVFGGFYAHDRAEGVA